jgi:hypothetical protein
MFLMAKLLIFLKFAMGTAATGLGVTIAFDIYDKWGGLKRVTVKTLKAIPFSDEHTTVLGLTRHGKTFAVMHSIKDLKEGVFFFNVQNEKTPPNFSKANGNNSWEQIKELLREGKKINYIPSDDLELASKELGYIVNNLYESGHMNVRMVIDECHLFSKVTKDKSALKACIRLATTGLRRGYKAIYLTQRPAMIDNTLYTQSTKHILFALGKADYAYLKQQGFPVEEIYNLTKNEKYKFCIFDQKEVHGAYMIK